MRRSLLTFLICLFVGTTGQVIAQSGEPFSDPEPLNTNASDDYGNDQSPQLTTDGAGHWVAVWVSHDSLGGTIGTDGDILVARSTDRGETWSDPEPLNTNANVDGENDDSPQLTTDGAGHWVAVWASRNNLGGTIGTDRDVLMARSTDNGQTWTDPAPLNTNADTDTGDDQSPQLTTDGAGRWVAVWYSDDSLGGTIGTDTDILVARSTDGGQSWSDPEPLNTNAGTDEGYDWGAQSTTDGAGRWVTVWTSDDSLGGMIGTDTDILVARSTDSGETWTDPAPLNTNAGTDTSGDRSPQLTTDGAGRWLAVWSSLDIGGIALAHSMDGGQTWSDRELISANVGESDMPQLTTDGAGRWIAVWMSWDDLGGTIGTDPDILKAGSTDNGQTWTEPDPLNTNAITDNDLWLEDWSPQLTTDGAGRWVAVWSAVDPEWVEFDIATAHRSYCPLLTEEHAYGRLLFAPSCSRDASNLAEDVYDSVSVGVDKGTHDAFYLSSDGIRFAPLVGDDEIHIEGVDSGFGPYDYQPEHQGGPPYPLTVPIETILVPKIADDADPAPGLIPFGSNQVLFELLDTDREICGNTALYLVRDCGIYMEKTPNTTLHWVSYSVEVDSLQSNLDVVSGTISEFLEDRSYSRACVLGTFIDTAQAVDPRPNPPPGEGYYYLTGGTCGQPIGHGDSSLVPDPRDDLPPVATCPGSECWSLVEQWHIDFDSRAGMTGYGTRDYVLQNGVLTVYDPGPQPTQCGRALTEDEMVTLYDSAILVDWESVAPDYIPPENPTCCCDQLAFDLSSDLMFCDGTHSLSTHWCQASEFMGSLPGPLLDFINVLRAIGNQIGQEC